MARRRKEKRDALLRPSGANWRIGREKLLLDTMPLETDRDHELKRRNEYIQQECDRSAFRVRPNTSQPSSA